MHDLPIQAKFRRNPRQWTNCCSAKDDRITMGNIQSAYEGGLIEAMSGQLTHTQNPHMKKLCRAIITIVSVLGGEKEEQIDWASIGVSLLALLFSSNVQVSNAGKTTLLNMMKLNDKFIHGLLQNGILDQAAEVLKIISSTGVQLQSSQVVVTSSQQITMNILELLEEILCTEAIQFFKSIKLISVLEKIKNEGSTKKIREKAKHIQDLINKDGQAERTEIDLVQANQHIQKQEQQIQVITEEKAQVEIRANRAEGQVQVLTEEKAQVEIRANRAEGQVLALTTTAEGQIRTLATQITQKDQSIKTLTTENAQLLKRANVAEEQIIEKQKQITTANNQIDDILIQIRKGLEKIITDPQQIDRDQIQQRQVYVCELINNKFEDKNDDEGRVQFIKAGIAKALINIFEKQNVQYIKEYHVKAFNALTFPASCDVELLIYSQSPIEGLLKLLKHTNADISFYAISSFFNIIYAGTNTTSVTVQHPHFDALATYDGIEQLYQFTLSSNAYDDSKNRATVSIACLYRAKVIEKTIIRESAINRLKKLVNDARDWEKDASRYALRLLARNPVNEAEIKKGGFTIPN
ncbi:MAG: hypothetical protein EZS28_018595 [Streblomastix strix]|uniref:Uncharacterized protein n=1 Tax=Streblomastix strix TaxID=222440 RepID=A0A5J4VTH8_9EUKA|nr:MAG: hypothetical protein EZS28_018595 [Streblomastix strix]